MNALRRLLSARDGGTAAEFGLIVPLIVMFIIGTIDVGRLMWTWNQAEKAAQMGARWAAATNFLVPDIATTNFVTRSDGAGGTLTQGDVIPTTAYGTTSCTSTSTATTNVPANSVTCTCTTGTCPWALTATTGNEFNAIYQRMASVMPLLKPNNIRVVYAPSGLGFAGDPNGADVAPLVTVSISGITYNTLIAPFFKRATIPLPAFTTSLTMEDGNCATVSGNPACYAN